MGTKRGPITLVVLLALFIVGCGQSNNSSSNNNLEAGNNTEQIDNNAVITSLYNQSCIACHSSGSAGAPRAHDVHAWKTRLDKGMDVLLTHTKSGLKAMPPMGMCRHCTDADFEQLIIFMSSPK
ncbi:MAG: c-type cytochrome [Spongiibacteraceae bacterium]